jgi:hypothetical protein
VEYPKTDNLFNRDPDTHKTPPALGFRAEGVEQIGRWLVTEKIDGMNMRVVWEPDTLAPPAIYGRTDRAQIPGDLLALMQATFTHDAMIEAFRDEADQIPERVVLFGEGFGAGIQSGGHYGPTKNFALFDVVVNGTWLKWADVCDVAYKLRVPTVPVLAANATLDYVQALAQVGASTLLVDGHPKVEGIVARTDPYLFTQRGNRVMFKAKVKDLT